MKDHNIGEIVQNWLLRARSDLELGKAALHTKGVLPEDACFHAQQCAEKSLKACLIHFEIPYPRTHSIEVLIGLIQKTIQVPEAVQESYFLTEYAVQSRYPGDWEPVTDSEAKKALEQAYSVFIWVNQQLKLEDH